MENLTYCCVVMHIYLCVTDKAASRILAERTTEEETKTGGTGTVTWCIFYVFV